MRECRSGEDCRLPNLPACAGEFDPSACVGCPKDLFRRSAYRSAVDYGWPAPRSSALRPPRRPPRGSLVIRAPLDAGDTGYGRLALALGQALDASGVPVCYEPVEREGPPPPLHPWVASRVTPDPSAAPTLVVAPPIARLPVGRPVAVLTMWESTSLPEGTADRLAHARAIIVPCLWCADSFATHGLPRPSVVPLGVDTATFRPGDTTTAHDHFTVGTVARVAHGGARKGLPELAGAFLVAAGDRPWRLVVKCWPDCLPRLEAEGMPVDPRIEYDTRQLTDAELADWYRGLDVYASASKGEGCGLPPLEAMACGVPYVGPDHSGLAEFARPECGWIVPSDPAPGGAFYADRGQWYVPRPEDLAAALRVAATRPDLLRRKGARAAAVAAEFTWQRTALGVKQALRAVGMLTSPVT